MTKIGKFPCILEGNVDSNFDFEPELSFVDERPFANNKLINNLERKLKSKNFAFSNKN